MSLNPPLPAHPALLLDLDGTLLDIAPTPASVVVPPDLPETLRRLREALGGALAIVTGRPIDQIDALLGDAPHAVAGEHGGAVRHAPGDPVVRAALPPRPQGWLAAADDAVRAHPGALVEEKPRGFVLHYRLAPEAGPALQAAALRIVGDRLDDYVILPAHMAWEVRPRGADKGTAVTALMQRPPFTGRVPVYVGDDVTDEDGMRVARALGGVGWRVQEVFGTPHDVRAWLAAAAICLHPGP
jgi:trehalose 6-phosphate phosphatase